MRNSSVNLKESSKGATLSTRRLNRNRVYIHLLMMLQPSLLSAAYNSEARSLYHIPYTMEKLLRIFKFAF